MSTVHPNPLSMALLSTSGRAQRMVRLACGHLVGMVDPRTLCN
jgi:hypothetical protein